MQLVQPYKCQVRHEQEGVLLVAQEVKFRAPPLQATDVLPIWYFKKLEPFCPVVFSDFLNVQIS